MTTITDARNFQNSGIGQISRVVDKSTNVRTGLPHAVRKAHDGEAFFLTTYIDRDEDAYATILFQTPNTTTRIHFTAEVYSSSAAVNLQFLEGVTDALEEPSPFFNVRRESANTAEITWVFSGAAATGGTALFTATVPYLGGYAPFRIGGLVEDSNERAELVLKPNTKYALETQAILETTINFALEFYEHIDKL
jgi:hypothetical protein